MPRAEEAAPGVQTLVKRKLVFREGVGDDQAFEHDFGLAQRAACAVLVLVVLNPEREGGSLVLPSIREEALWILPPEERAATELQVRAEATGAGQRWLQQEVPF
jgi:hypothetical protein